MHKTAIGDEYTTEQVLKAAEELGVTGQPGLMDIPKEIKDVGEYIKYRTSDRTLDKIGRGWDKVSPTTVARTEEDWMRLSIFYDRLMKGDTPEDAAAMEWTRNAASRDSLNYILRLKETLTIVANGNRIVLFHKSPNNFQEYIFPGDVTPDLLSNINGDVLVLGHTHIPFKMDYGMRGLVVNPGSVGQPRDGNPDASFAVLDTVTREIEHKQYLRRKMSILIAHSFTNSVLDNNRCG